MTVRLVDEAGRPVEGTSVGKSASGKSGRDPVWTFYLPSNVSDGGGIATLPTRELGANGVVLYALHEDCRLAAFQEVPRDAVNLGVDITLRPACRVHGRIVSSELAALGRELSEARVYLYRGEDDVLFYQSTNQEFHFFLPAGDYRLTASGTDLRSFSRTFTVEPEQKELDVGPIDLPAEMILTLIGKPAPELRKIKGWKNGPPIALQDLRGKIVLLNFSGNAHGQFFRNMPFWMSLHDAFREKDVVVLGIFDDSVEDVARMDERFRPARERMWRGRDIPFPVALDGGGETIIAGTDAKVQGGTTAAYRISSSRTGLLIDREGNVVSEFSPFNTEHVNLLRRMVGVPTDESPFTLTHTPQWLKRLGDTYRLDAGESLRLIPPPFIPERAQFVTLKYRHNIGFPERLTLVDDGELKDGGSGSVKLRDILAALKSRRDPDDLIDCPVRLAEIDVPGDWVMRKESTLAERLNALERVLNRRLNRQVRIERDQVERDAIVVRGRYQFQPLAGAPDDQTLNVTADPLDLIRECGGGSGEFADLLAWLSRHFHRRVLDETTEAPTGELRWRQRESTIVNFRVENPPELDIILTLLEAQTSLEFTRERREVEVWTVRDVGDERQ